MLGGKYKMKILTSKRNAIMNEPVILIDSALRIIWIIFRTLLLMGLSFIILYPLVYMFSMAIRPVTQIHDPAVVWIPKVITFENIKTAMEKMNMLNSAFKNNSIVNTIMLDVVSAILQVCSTVIVGYGFARFKFRFRGFLFGIVIFSMIVPINSIIIPTYLNLRYFDFFGIGSLLGYIIKGSPYTVSLVDTFGSFYIPAALSSGIRSGMCIFIFRQFFRGMPKELEDAAAIDGCGSFRTFLQIFVPNAAPPVLTTFIFSIVWYWNDYYYSAMFFPRLSTISISLSSLKSILWTDLSTRDPYVNMITMQAGSLITILPLLIFYLVLQRYFTESIERTGIVG
jgi:multiple sugar transport system permease protein